ncbi:MAG: hypothetical protein HC923_01595, partial [Myxococcales bacterium]|nr:hypothetical protein [Myxococcales bacterium]
ERDGYYQYSVRSSSDGPVEERVTLEDTADGRRQTVERWYEGSLRVLESAILQDEQFTQGPGISECLSQAVSCSASQQAMLESSFREAILRGTSCMSSLSEQGTLESQEIWSRFQALKNLWSRAGVFGCMPAACTFAHWGGGLTPGTGPYEIKIGYEGWTGRPRNQQLGTLFHEFMHGVLGGHLDVVVNSEINSPADRRGRLTRRYVDRVDACEAYCFGTDPTSCSCAKCLGLKACEGSCASLARCSEFECTGSGGCVAIMSEAVGTACVKVEPDGKEQSATWYSNCVACEMSTCVSEGGTCQSFSLSCQESCK